MDPSRNGRAIRAYRACGFGEEGRLHRHLWSDGASDDAVSTGILREEEAMDPLERPSETEPPVVNIVGERVALGLHSVMLTVAEFNLAGHRAYEKAGFREFGRRRQCRWLGGRLWDDVSMDCIAAEFTSPVLGRVFAPDEPRT